MSGGTAMPLAPLAAATDPGTVEVFAHPDALPADVQGFMHEAEKRNVGLGLCWYRNLVAAVYADDPGVRFYVLRNKGQVRAVMPLRAEKERLGWRLTSLSNFYTSLYEPVLAPGVTAAGLLPLLSALNREFRPLSSLMLAPMDAGGEAYRTLLGAMRLKGWLPFEYFSFGNWYLPVSFDWNKYLAQRSSTQRNTIRRMGKKFANDGGVLEIVTGPDDLPGAIEAYERVYAASWKKPEPFPAFVPGLVQSCAAKGYLRLGLAWLGGEPVAAQVWIVAHGRAEIYKVAYDEKFKAYSPGTLVTALLMQHVIDVDKVGEVDYLIGEDPYKKTWMSHRRDRRGIIAYNPRALSGLAGLARESAGRLVKAVRAWLHSDQPGGGAGTPPHS
ncbi:GNAT family N-acetyltransferase [Massilia cavernae]|nr:GNAT family N-acetyltransferase [Massilia cavernae]